MAGARIKRRGVWNHGDGRSLLLVFLASAIALPAPLARADSFLHALSEGMKKDYRETRALGAAPTATQINQIRREIYTPIMARAISEGNKIIQQERGPITGALIELRYTLFADIYKKAPHAAAAGHVGAGGDNNAVGPGSAGSDAGGSMSRSNQNRPAATAAGGSDGAKDVGFTGKKHPVKEKAPSVDSDGIIQDR